MPAPFRPPLPPASTAKKIVFGTIPAAKGQRILLYGPGGIGKTELACNAPGGVAMLDADESLGVLKKNLIEHKVALPKLISGTDWESTRAALNLDGYDSIKTIVIDTATKLEEWCIAYTLKNVKNDKGSTVSSVEDYGFGKGYQHVFEKFTLILGDLDRHARAGRNIILIAHDCTNTVPNPSGGDWIRYEPRLQTSKTGAASIRLRLKEWCDHVLFIGYDVAVGKDKKGQGSGTRTMYTSELPHCMAKSRTTSEQINIELGGANPWDTILV